MKSKTIFCDSCNKSNREEHLRPVRGYFICTQCNLFLLKYKKLHLSNNSKLVIKKTNDKNN